MNKAEFVTNVALKAGVKKVEAEKVINAYHDVVINALQNSDDVSITGWGKFSAKTRAARIAKNPLDPNGAPISIPEKRVAGFKPGKAFKDALNQD